MMDDRLKFLLESYGLNYSRVITKNDNVVDLGKYNVIKSVLEYLIKDKKISPRRIENCGGLLFLNPTAIKDNYEFLLKSDLNRSKINYCLHVLSTNPSDLRQTYKYVVENYGLSRLKWIVSILAVPVSYIKEIENLFISYGFKIDDGVLSAAVYTCRPRNKDKLRFDIERVNDILQICRNNNLEPRGNIFHACCSDIVDVINVCKKYDIKPTGTVFQRTGKEIEDIVQLCNNYGINVLENITVFDRTPIELERILKVCKDKKIIPSGVVFQRTPEDIEKIIEIVEERKISLKRNLTIFHRTPDEILDIIDVCLEIGIDASGVVFKRTADEIREIYELCSKKGIDAKGVVFQRSVEEIEEIIKICEDNNISIKGNRDVFGRKPDEVTDILNLCKENKLEASGIIFQKNPESLKKSIEFIKNNYDERFLKRLIVFTDVKHLEKVFSVLNSKNILDTVIDSPSILRLNYNDIMTRMRYLEDNGLDVVTSGKYNSIFGMNDDRMLKKFGVVQKDLNARYQDIVKVKKK